MQDTRNVYLTFGGSVVDEIVTDGKTSQTRFNFVARTPCFGMPPTEQEPVGEIVD
jgi:hypothetical protein